MKLTGYDQSAFIKTLEKLNQKLNLKVNDVEKLRLFNAEGMEMFNEDFKFLSDKEVLYVSKGEEFNVNTYYSEYKILKILGQGGFGKVYAAMHKMTKEKVAIKITNSGGLDHCEDIESIFSEAETLKSLAHPNIVKIINFFVIKKTLQTYFIMEMLEGGELLKLLEERKVLNEEDALTIFKQIISAIDYCHRQKIIHRDLKLENIMRVNNESLTIKIVDFGIAGLFAGRKSEVTRAGSLYYMAPEVLSRKSMVAAPSMDIWAVGCILYALVIGQLPYNDKSESGLVRKIIDQELEFPKNNKLSPEVIDLLEQMLNKNHEKRIKMSDIQQHPWYLKQKL